MRVPTDSQPTWTIVHSRDGLDPTRFLGTLADLPIGERDPGDWCDIAVADSEGVMRWTLVVVERTPPISMVAARREAASRSIESCGTGRREREVAPLSPDFSAREPAGRTQDEGSAAGSARKLTRRWFAPAA